MGNNNSTKIEEDKKVNDEQVKETQQPQTPQRAFPKVSFQSLPISSFKIQELYVEQAFCPYLRDVMAAIHHYPHLPVVKDLKDEQKQVLYGLYWSCLLSSMDSTGAGQCLPPSKQINLLASQLITSKFNNYPQLIDQIGTCGEKHSDTYQLFIKKHFEAANYKHDDIDYEHRVMVNRSLHEKLFTSPEKVVGEGGYCTPVKFPVDHAIQADEFESYYKYRLCMIANVCANEVKQCMDREGNKVGSFMECANSAEVSSCISKLNKEHSFGL